RWPGAAPPRPTRRTTTTATTPPTAPGTRSAATATRSAGGSRRWPRDHPRRGDERRRRARVARRAGVLRGDRPPYTGAHPLPPPAPARPGAVLRVRAVRPPSRAAAALHRRRRARHVRAHRD